MLRARGEQDCKRGGGCGAQAAPAFRTWDLGIGLRAGAGLRTEETQSDNASANACFARIRRSQVRHWVQEQM